MYIFQACLQVYMDYILWIGGKLRNFVLYFEGRRPKTNSLTIINSKIKA